MELYLLEEYTSCDAILDPRCQVLHFVLQRLALLLLLGKQFIIDQLLTVDVFSVLPVYFLNLGRDAAHQIAQLEIY